ncbi:MAG: hypothetical protein Kow00122_08960 [Thermoleophilia bacterium]
MRPSPAALQLVTNTMVLAELVWATESYYRLPKDDVRRRGLAVATMEGLDFPGLDLVVPGERESSTLAEPPRKTGPSDPSPARSHRERLGPQTLPQRFGRLLEGEQGHGGVLRTEQAIRSGAAGVHAPGQGYVGLPLALVFAETGFPAR